MNNYTFWYQGKLITNNKELSDRMRSSLKNYYKTAVLKHIHLDAMIPMSRTRSFLYRRSQLNAFDLMILLNKYDFLRESVGFAKLPLDFNIYGNKSREQIRKNILMLLKNNPELTFRDLSQLLNISDRVIEYQIGCLIHAGLLRRIGAKKNGQWAVV